MNLCRLLIPTWRFFDRVGLEPELFLLNEESRWVHHWEKPPVRWFSLFFNADGNLWHARNNLLERLLTEVGPNQGVDNLCSYRLVVSELKRDGAQIPFDFKVRANGEDALIARVEVA